MPASPPKLAWWLFLLCLTCGLLFGSALSYQSRSSATETTTATKSPPKAPERSLRAEKLSRCQQLLAQPADVDKTELLELVEALAFAQEDQLSPILDQLIQIFGTDRGFRVIVMGWAIEHPHAAMKFALSVENSNHPIISNILSSALNRPEGAKLFIEHASDEKNSAEIHWPNLVSALRTAELAGVDPVETIKSLPKSLQSTQFYKLLWDRSLSNPREAFDLALSDPALAEDSKAAAFWLVHGLFEQEPEAVDTFLQRVPEASKNDFATAGLTALVSIGNSAAAFQLADQLLSTGTPTEDPEIVMQYLTNGFITSGLGTGELVEWLRALPSAELRATGEKIFINEVIRRDPDTVVPWLQASPAGEVRDAYLAKLLYDLPSDHPSFNSLLEMIADPAVRSSAEETVASRPRFDAE